MTKAFYQTDVAQDESIWTSSVTYGTWEEHYRDVLEELASDWDREGLNVPEGDGPVDSLVFCAELSAIGASASTLLVDPVVALAKLGKLSLPGLDIEAVLAGEGPVALIQPETKTIYVGAVDSHNGTVSIVADSEDELIRKAITPNGGDFDAYREWLAAPERIGADGEYVPEGQWGGDPVVDYMRQHDDMFSWSYDTHEIPVPPLAPAVEFARRIAEEFGPIYDDDSRWDNVGGGDATEWLGDIIQDAKRIADAPPQPEVIISGRDCLSEWADAYLEGVKATLDNLPLLGIPHFMPSDTIEITKSPGPVEKAAAIDLLIDTHHNPEGAEEPEYEEETADKFRKAVKALVDARGANAEIAVIMEGGLVQHVTYRGAKPIVSVVDYDADVVAEADEAELRTIEQDNAGPQRARVTQPNISEAWDPAFWNLLEGAGDDGKETHLV